MALELLRIIGRSEFTTAAASLAIISQTAPRFLSGLAFLGRIGFLLELLLGAATVATGTVGALRCFGRSSLRFGSAHINEECEPAGNQPQARSECDSEQGIEVTIRFEDRFVRILNRHRCVVTIRRPFGDVQDTGREVWYARDKK